MAQNKNIADTLSCRNDDVISSYLDEIFDTGLCGDDDTYETGRIIVQDKCVEQECAVKRPSESGLASAGVISHRITQPCEFKRNGDTIDWLALSTIPKDRQLRSTILPDLSVGGKNRRTKGDALLVLLECLHFLNKPLSPRLRKSFTLIAEQSIDAFHAADWQISLNSRPGVVSEIR